MLKEEKRGEKNEVCQMTQELDWKAAGLLKWWIQILGLNHHQIPRGQETGTTVCVSRHLYNKVEPLSWFGTAFGDLVKDEGIMNTEKSNLILSYQILTFKLSRIAQTPFLPHLHIRYMQACWGPCVSVFESWWETTPSEYAYYANLAEKSPVICR